jgi:hypothetical protein
MSGNRDASLRPHDCASLPRIEDIDSDEDAVDLGQYSRSQGAIGNAGSLPGRSAAGGGSSVITWDELIRQHTPGDPVFDMLISRDNHASVDSHLHGLEKTDYVDALPIVHLHSRRNPECSNPAAPDAGESSAVDLYTTPAVRMPYRTAIDSSVALASIDQKQNRSEAANPDDIALPSVHRSGGARWLNLRTQQPSSSRGGRTDDEHSASSPRIALRPSFTMASVCGGLVGLLLGVLASFAWHGSGTVGVASKSNAAIADQLWAHGLRAYQQRDFAAAIQWFATAEQAVGSDARHAYFLGLARHSLGQADAAMADFRRAAELEWQGIPNAAEVDRALEAVPPEVRRVIIPFRPKR